MFQSFIHVCINLRRQETRSLFSINTTMKKITLNIHAYLDLKHFGSTCFEKSTVRYLLQVICTWINNMVLSL